MLTTRLSDLKYIVLKRGYLKCCINGKSFKIYKQIFGAPSGITSPSNVPYWQQPSKEAPSANSDRALNN